MMQMMRGDAYYIRITLLKEDDEPILDTDVAKVNITCGGLVKSYPNGDVGFDDGEWLYPVTQLESLSVFPSISNLSVRVKFNSGDVEGARIGNVYIIPSQDKEEM